MPARSVRLREAVPGPLRAGLERLRQQVQVPDGFPAQVLEAAERSAREPRLPERDLTRLEFATVDPPGAKDLDQALCIERQGHGFVVWYAIADVSAFVTAGDPVDHEAHARGQTFYAPHLRTPLHPPVLSEQAASLLPGRVRPALVWRLTLDSVGSTVEAFVERALIRSREQLTYADAQRRIDGSAASESLLLLRSVGQLREQIEKDRGGVSLNIPDQEVRAQGSHWELEYRSTLPVEDWNAQISLLTGIAAARLMVSAKVGLLRTLPPAEPESLLRLRTIARALHIDWPAAWAYPEFVRSLDSTRGDHAAMMYACATLFRGAGYQAFRGAVPDQPLHAALAVEYAHATAPLRRLADRYVLEICAAICAGNDVPEWALEQLDGLPSTMAQSDRRAKAYERGIVDLTEALVLSGRVGQVFTGTVVEADPKRSKGRFVIKEPAVEASVKGTHLPLGQELRAKLTGVDLRDGGSTFIEDRG